MRTRILRAIAAGLVIGPLLLAGTAQLAMPGIRVVSSAGR
jgi:hypothetical protein